jgi:hypothetical protein
MQYYFDIRSDGTPVRDNVGSRFSTASAAIAHSQSLANGLRLQKTLSGRNLRICVVSEGGMGVHEELVFPLLP